MKRIVILLLTAFAAFAAWSQEAGKSTTVEFDSYTCDYGTISEVDGRVSHTFKYKNTGSIPFVITNVTVSCGCTTPEYKRSPLMPGQTGEIKITFDPTGRPGRIDKTVYVLGNDARREIRLTLTGEVVPRPRTIEDDYPINLGSGLRLSSANVYFGNIARGKVHSRSVELINTGSAALTVSADPVAGGCPAFVSTQLSSSTVVPGGKTSLVVTIDASQTDIWGQYIYEIPIMVNGVKAGAEIKVMAAFVEDFSVLSQADRANPPSLGISSFFYHFSNVKQGEVLQREFTISNRGGNDLIIRHVQSKDGIVKYKLSSDTIKPGESATLTLTLPTKGLSGRISDAAIIISNDPDRALREIRLMANVVDE